jgi:hypothetical protein
MVMFSGVLTLISAQLESSMSVSAAVSADAVSSLDNTFDFIFFLS